MRDFRYDAAVNDAPLTVLLDRAGVAGGAERYWQIVVPALREAGLDVRLIARTVTESRRYGGEVIEIPWGGDDGIAVPEAAERVRTLLREIGGGIVVTASVFDPAVLDVVRAEADRWIVRIHDHRAFCPNGDRLYPQFSGICDKVAGASCAVGALVRGCMSGPRLASAKHLSNRLAVARRIEKADAVLVSSAYMHASALANHIDPRRVVITPPPLSDRSFVRDVAPRPFRDTILFSGRLTPQKGLRSLVRAIGSVAPSRRPRLLVAGTGDDEAPARALAARLGVEVAWRGWLDMRALRDAIDEATIVAVPSLEAEPFGLVGIEAQARGRPAVAYAVGGIPDWIADAGIAVARGDERALGKAIVDALDADRWTALSIAARRSSERYRLRPHVERMLDVLDARPLPCTDVATAVAAAMPAAPARPTRRSPERPSRPAAGTQSSG
jgi:glycosyltransferase involved in cell wall biosynthesis